MPDQLRIAYFSPLPPARSGIADYSAELLPPLAERAHIALFVDNPMQGEKLGLPIDASERFPERRWEFDLALYHMGNSDHHATIYRMLRAYPGVVVLHDLFLHHFLAHTTAGRGNRPGYARELRYALGDEGRLLYDDIRLGRRATPLAEVALNERLLDTSLATIVHSNFARGQISAVRPDARLATIPQLIAPRDGRSRRAELGLDPETLLLGSVGQVTAARQLPLVLDVLRDLLDRGVAAHLLIVGEILPEVDLAAEIAARNLADNVSLIGYAADLDEFVDWTATLDVAINLRYPTMGETSASTLRAMDTGRPVMVYDHGWYSELPTDTVVKLPADPDRAILLNALTELAENPSRRQDIGEAARAYVRNTCSPEAVAGAYVAFLDALREEWWHAV